MTRSWLRKSSVVIHEQTQIKIMHDLITQSEEVRMTTHLESLMQSRIMKRSLLNRKKSKQSECWHQRVYSLCNPWVKMMEFNTTWLSSSGLKFKEGAPKWSGKIGGKNGILSKRHKRKGARTMKNYTRHKKYRFHTSHRVIQSYIIHNTYELIHKIQFHGLTTHTPP